MDAALINPETGVGQNVELYMAPLYLATILDRNGYDVTIIDAQTEDPRNKLKSLINKIDYVGFSVTTSQMKQAIELSDFVKDANPEIPVVWGGIHPTLFPEQTIHDPSIDYVVRGEGEVTLLELTRFFDGVGKLSEIKGLTYKKEGEVKVNPERPYLDLNSLSPPSWHLLDLRKYIRDYIVGDDNYGRALPLHSGRGCVYRCTFCINTLLAKKKYRPLNPKNMVNEMTILKDKYNLDFIKLVDENFFINKKRVDEFCETLIKEKLDLLWYGGGRADYFNERHLNKALLNIIKKSGGAVISMGVESGSQRILDMIKKDITPEQVIKAVKAMTKVGIKPQCSFMIGLPGETKKDMEKTLLLIKKIKEISPSAHIIGPQIFRPYPGAELYEKVKELGFREPEDLRGWIGADKNWGGYVSSDHLPWVSEPEYVDAVSFYVTRLGFVPSTMRRKIPENIFFKPIANFRVRYNIFGYPFDRKIFETIKSAYYKTKINRLVKMK